MAKHAKGGGGFKGKKAPLFTKKTAKAMGKKGGKKKGK